MWCQDVVGCFFIVESAIDLIHTMDQPCTDAHLSQISEWILDWRAVAPFLGLEIQEDEVGYQDDSSAFISSTRTGMAMLNAWKERYGPGATYGRLAHDFRQCGRLDLAERVSELQAQVPDQTSSSRGKDNG